MTKTAVTEGIVLDGKTHGKLQKRFDEQTSGRPSDRSSGDRDDSHTRVIKRNFGDH